MISPCAWTILSAASRVLHCDGEYSLHRKSSIFISRFKLFDSKIKVRQIVFKLELKKKYFFVDLSKTKNLNFFQFHIPTLVSRALSYDPFRRLDLLRHPLNFVTSEIEMTAYQSYKVSRFKTTLATFDDSIVRGNWKQKLECPRGKIRLTIR